MTFAVFYIALISGLHTWFRLRYYLHIFQLEGYKRNEYHAWLGNHISDAVFTNPHLIGGVVVAFTSVGMLYSPIWAVAICLPIWTMVFISSQSYSLFKAKKPIRYTPRLRRLLAVSIPITLIPVLSGYLLYENRAHPVVWCFYLFGWLLADVGVPAWVSAAALFLKPVETSIQNGFKRSAKKRLASRPDLKTVAITGSYGKTSVKFIVAEILGQQFNVLATPGSYNTPMGICLVVNNQLRNDHQILILEMGARYSGDIAELCELAPPDVAVVTSVGIAHLETMGPIENIARVKQEIVEFAKPGAEVILNADDPRVNAMATAAGGKIWRASITDEPADIHGWDISYGPSGASFMVQDETGARHRFETQLLGAHNVLNILLGIAVGRSFGLRLRQMAAAVRRIEPVPHRLALRQEGAFFIIDDAFNSNPVGARNAVDILASFTSGRRIIVTPGMVELGLRQEEENRAFGRYIAKAGLDLVILVGKSQTEPIQHGLEDEQCSPESIRIVGSLFEARDVLTGYLKAGDVVLYENDLPDQYDEK